MSEAPTAAKPSGRASNGVDIGSDRFCWRLIRSLLQGLFAFHVLVGCSPSESPKPAAVAVSPPSPAHPHPAQQDWFHEQLPAAREAKREHLAAGDIAGAQTAYDGIVRDTCVQVSLSGTDKYKARCDALLSALDAKAPAEPDPFACDDNRSDEASLTACND